jgi:hypothetical protein
MRKNGSGFCVFSTAVLLLGVYLWSAPVFGGRPNDWGIKAGVSVSNQSFHYKTMAVERHFTEYRGLNLDLFANTVQSDHWAVAGQLSYSRKGFAEELPTTYVDPSSPQGYTNGGKRVFTNTIDYISVSVFGKINAGVKAFKPYVFCGPRLDFPMRTKSISSSIDDHLKNNWGISAGCGCEFKFFWPDRMLVEFQYSPDMSDIYRTDRLSIRKSSYEAKLGVVF